MTESSLPGWGRDGFNYGVRQTLALLPGTAVFGAAFGAVAVQKNMTLAEAVAMSAIVFSGAAQMVAMEIWNDALTFGAIVTLTAVTLVISLRMVLMGASLQPWLGVVPAARIYPLLMLNTDSTWLIAIRYRDQGGRDASVLVGVGLVLWSVWQVSTVAGYLLGELIAHPERYGLDLILPIFFITLITPLWRGPRRAIPWAVGGVVSVVAQYLIPGFWFIVIGALAGAISGGFIDESE